MTVWTSERVVTELRRKGELLEPSTGVVSVRGDALALMRALELRLVNVAVSDGFDEWSFAPAIGMQTLARAGYFESFPQWLTTAAHLSDDPATLERVARAANPAVAAGEVVRSSACALPPALCYQVYGVFAGRTVTAVRIATQGTCWRWEEAGFRPLERGWAFTMRELVHLGTPADVQSFRARGAEQVQELARGLGLEGRMAAATDPFFAPTARGRAVLQRIKDLKTELRLPVGGGESVAAASINDHERFFGERFDIRLPDGEPAASGCVAFGLDRWLLAFLVAHGTEANGWPDVRV
jgi:seryl-tRNA synthetase